jgi:hypothetical protein
VQKILKFFFARLTKISASAKCCGAENSEFFFSMLSKFSASDNYGGAENFENFFTKTNQIFRLSQGLWCGNF